jgi:glycosyltransferase involved in cell wall biosynthesis
MQRKERKVLANRNGRPKNRIGVLLATHNPNLVYLKQFIASLEKQDTLEFDLIWNDDGSSDEIYFAATEIINHQFESLATRRREGGAKENFMSLLKANDAYDYIFFADQDDIWIPNRINRQIELFNGYHKNSLEPGGNYFNPIIFDGKKEFISERELAKFQVLLSMNTVQGCTLMINGAAAQRITASNYSDAIMHDWWISLYLSALDSLYFFNEPLLKYRLHDGNLVGIPNNRERIRMYLFRKSGLLSAQNSSFFEQFSSEMPFENTLKLKFWLKNYTSGTFTRFKSIFQDHRRSHSLRRDFLRRLLHATRQP